MLDVPTERFEPETNGEISESLLQTWTPQARECYKIRCDCSQCSIHVEEYSFACQMPKIIARLKQKALAKKINC